MVSTQPADYDSSSVRIDVTPKTMHYYATYWMPKAIANIQDDWKKIDAIWDELKIGWVGDTSEAATAFNERLKDIQNSLFGTPDKNDPTKVDKPGILDRVRYAGAVAAQNYNSAEHSVTDMWDQFVNDITGEGDGKGPQDVTEGPVQVDYTDNPFPKPKDS